MEKAVETKNDAKTEIELVDIEDIVPIGDNSLFLCLARVLIYMSHENANFSRALEKSCGLTGADMRSDIDLQLTLRKKLCEFFYQSGLVYSKTQEKFQLSKSYTKCFGGNVYDFLIQVYQLSVNNFSSNLLFRRFAISAFSKILKINICYKKCRGHWRLFEPNVKAPTQTTTTTTSPDCLDQSTIYLQEIKLNSTPFSSAPSPASNIPTTKNVRLLLSKKLWLSKYYSNSYVCMKFTQFNDAYELTKYEEQNSCLNPSQLFEEIFMSKAVKQQQEQQQQQKQQQQKQEQQTSPQKEVDHITSIKIFCVLLSEMRIERLVKCEQPPIMSGSLPNKQHSNQAIKNRGVEVETMTTAKATKKTTKITTEIETEFELSEEESKSYTVNAKLHEFVQQFVNHESPSKEKLLMRYLNYLMPENNKSKCEFLTNNDTVKQNLNKSLLLV